jgi:hypothetical protein
VNGKQRTLLLAGLLSAGAAQSQNFMGIAPTPSGGTHSLYLNPALAAGSPYRLYVNLGAANLHLNNDYAQWVGPYNLTRLVTGRAPDAYRNSDGSVALEPTYFRERLDDRPKQGTAWTDVRGPSVLVSLGSKTGLAFSTRLRAAAQVDGVSERLLSLVRLGLDVPALWNVTNVDNRFNANANVYTEIGGTLAHTLIETDQHALRAGGTLKYLSGRYAAYVRNRGLSYRVVPTGDEGRLTLESFDAEFGYVGQAALEQARGLGGLLGQGAPGRGWGVDAGLTYELRTDAFSGPGTPNAYKLRLGLALLDLGRITYDDPNLVRNYDVQRTNTNVTLSEFDNVKGSDELLGVLERTLAVQDSEITTRFRTGLPAALSANADWRVGNEFFLNLTVLRNLRSAEAVSLRQPNVIAITPRLEASEVTVSVPMQFINNHFTLGAAIVLGPLLVGTDNLIGLLGATKTFTPQGVDAYAGLSIPIRKRNR